MTGFFVAHQAGCVTKRKETHIMTIHKKDRLSIRIAENNSNHDANKVRNEGAEDQITDRSCSHAQEEDEQPEVEHQFEVLRSLCRFLLKAVRRRDERGAWAYLEAARCLALINLGEESRYPVGSQCIGLEADIQNGQWHFVDRSAEVFTRLIHKEIKSVQSARSRN